MTSARPCAGSPGRSALPMAKYTLTVGSAASCTMMNAPAAGTSPIAATVDAGALTVCTDIGGGCGCGAATTFLAPYCSASKGTIISATMLMILINGFTA